MKEKCDRHFLKNVLQEIGISLEPLLKRYFPMTMKVSLNI